MKLRWAAAGLVAVALAAVGGVADDKGADEKKADANGQPHRAESPDETALRAQIDAFTKAFNAGDAHAVAQLYATNARLVDAMGEAAEGREAIETEYAELFKENPGLTIEVEVDDLRLVSTDAAIDEGTTRVIPKNGAPPVVNHYSSVSIKQDGQWRLANVRETPGERSAQDQLRALEWLVGDWADESPDAAIRYNCHWSKDKQAIVREFTIRSRGKVVMTGVQRIGWDPCAEQIKSWEFDSEGGHGEGLWARFGDHWVVKATGVLQDGRTSTATHVIMPEDPSTCRWRTTDRTIGGQLIPVVQEFVMVRPAPEAGTANAQNNTSRKAPKTRSDQ